MNTWDPNVPLWFQIRARVAGQILAGELAEGMMLPSVRQVAAASQVNPLTVARAYQALVDEGLVEKQRGMGMSILAGARGRLLKTERDGFLEHEWPQVLARVRLLDLKLADLPQPSSGDLP